MKENGSGRLVSWKEIAAYLGVDVRTCLRWEKERGLPVHRPGGKPGPRVMAWEKELDEWLAGAAKVGDGGPTSGTEDAAKTGAAEREAASGQNTSRVRKRHFLIATMLAAAALGLFGYGVLSRDRVPADFRIDGSKLVILNKAGQDLWTFDTGMKDLWSESLYRARYQTRTPDPEDKQKYPPCLVIEDIDADGRREVLFVPHPYPARNSRTLYCFDDRGRRKWPAPFEGGREMVFGKRPFSWDYLTAFETADLDGDGRQEILVFSDHFSDWPTQLAILSPEGRLRGEYWNSGRITDFIYMDVDGDGRKEILIGGINNEYTKAFVAILDPNRVAGASPNSRDFRSPALASGTELAYVLLPLSDIDPYKDAHAVLNAIEVLDNGRLRVQMAKTNLQYELDPRTLACLDVTYAIQFKIIRQAAFRSGQVRGPLDEAYAKNLKNGFLYWTGTAWSAKPTRVRPLGR